jgi:acetoin utilization deacetylase AcuC-like enzyme
VIVVYSPRYHIDIGTHVFPTLKYQLLHDRIRADGGDGRTVPPTDFVEPAPASWDDLALVHTPEYLQKVQTGTFDQSELVQLELPMSPDVVEGFRLMTGGTLEAARRVERAARTSEGATRHPRLVSFHIGGGFHHAFADHGEGFCLFNDVAVAIRALIRDKAIERAAVVDLDVHHGNGTSFIFEREPRVFTFSMHQQHNYPVFKPRSSLDVGLDDGAGDSIYLRRLAPALEQVFAHRPDMVFYLAGADPYRDDQLGGLNVSKAALRERDRTVLRACAVRNIPVVVTLAGGYARRIDDTVDIHFATFDEARRI